MTLKPKPKPKPKAKTIAVLVFPGFQILDLAAMTVFETANAHLPPGEPAYDVLLLSEHGGPVRSSAGVLVETTAFAAFSPARVDTLLVAGANVPSKSSDGVIAFLQQALPRTRRLASICTGAFLLAEAGLLDGRRATTHWSFAHQLQQRHPAIRVEVDRIFIDDGGVWSSAGMSACIDLGLALVQADLGTEMSRNIARKLVVYHRRAGGQSQFSAMLDLDPKSDRIRQALAYARDHLQHDLRVEQLAEAAHLSPRQFSRAFLAETGQSPARAIEKLRVERAKLLLEAGGHAVDQVAAEVGFANPERMRRAFHRAFGQPPQSVKRPARQAAAVDAAPVA